MLKKFKLFIKKNSSLILTTISSIGVIATGISAIKATPKAIKIIEDEEQNGDHILSLTDKIKIGWPCYIPTILISGSTIFCIFGTYYLNKRNQASIIAAYSLLNNRFNEFKNKMLESSDGINLEHKIIESKYDNSPIDKDKELFFDYNSMQYFQSTYKDLERAEIMLNNKIYTDGYACMNDLYDILGIPHVPYGYQMGWTTIHDDSIYSHNGLKFNYETTVFDDGLECHIVTISCPPSWEYFC